MKQLKKFAILLIIILIFAACSPAATPSTPDKPDTPDVVTPDTPNDDTDAPVPDNVLLDKNAKPNREILPRGIKADDARLKDAEGAELVMYYASKDTTFSYTDANKNTVTDSGWLRRLSTEYNIRLYMVHKNPSTSLAAQRIALLSGAKLDILSFTPSQLPFAAGLTAELDDIAEEDLHFLNPTILRHGGDAARYLMPAGVARSLWYGNGGRTDPYALYQQKLWNYSAFESYITDSVQLSDGKIVRYGFEVGAPSELMSGLGSPLIDFKDGAFVQNDVSDTLHTLQTTLGGKGVYTNGQGKDAPSLLNESLMMRYGSTPFMASADKYPAVSWVPLPVPDGSDASGAVIANAPVLALPKNGTDPKAAMAAAMLFAARYADAHHDRLRFTYGLDYEKWRALYEYTGENITIAYLPDDETAAALGVWMRDADADIDARYPDVQSALDDYLKEQNYRLRYE